MEFLFEVGETEKTRVGFSRNPVTGRVTLTVNGESLTLASPWNPATHFSWALTQAYQLTVVGNQEKHEIVIVNERPRLLAGLRRQRYRVLVDGSPVAEHYGF